MVEGITYAAWSAHLNDTFRIHLDSGPIVLVELVQATGQSQRPAGDGQSGGESFSLVFQGPLDRMLAQGTYMFEHEQLGVFPLFIVPIGTSEGDVLYEAVFNRLPS